MSGHQRFDYRPEIDGLRGVAVLGVLLFHAFPSLLPGGFVGVDVFFVISGFLITGIVVGAVDRGTFRLTSFYARRIRRLFPALAMVLAATLLAGWYVLPPRDFAQLGRIAAAASAFVPNLALWRESGYFDAAANTKPLLHFWSLGVEEQFYLVWPVALAAAHRWRLPLPAAIAVLAAISLASAVVLGGRDPSAAFYFPHTRAWELLAGALLAVSRPGATSIAARGAYSSALHTVGSAVGVLLIVGSMRGLTGETGFPGWSAMAPVVGACAVIAAGPRGWLNSRALAHPALVAVGLVSYPLYLWHWPVLTFARLVSVSEPPPFVRVGLLLVSGALAVVTYRLVERPVRTGRFKNAEGAVALLVTCAAVVLCAGLAVSAHVVGPREDARTTFLRTKVYDYRTGYRGSRCQIGLQQTAADFAASCIDADFGSPDKTSVLIWGDSHAAHLYPGLRATAVQAGLSLAQYTGDACTPVVGTESPTCIGINAFVTDRLPAMAPDVVVLAAEWTPTSVARVPAGLDIVRARTRAPIVVVGPVPRWREVLPQVLVAYGLRHWLARVPERLQDEVEPASADLDAVLARTLAGQPNVSHVSAIGALCNAAGCLAVVDNQVTAFDKAHLTDVGSGIVARAIVRALPPARSLRPKS